MNRDSGPSSSLEISQLDIIKQHEGVVNFVPSSFDYKSDGFNENRSKHRNDPHTMKKLREKHAKKDKKKVNVSKKRGSNSSGGKAPAKRRRVVEVISRDKLRKIGLGIPSSGIDAQYHRLRYATLLCKYGSEKVENGYFSENDDPPRPRSSFTPKSQPYVTSSPVEQLGSYEVMRVSSFGDPTLVFLHHLPHLHLPPLLTYHHRSQAILKPPRLTFGPLKIGTSVLEGT
ncbi:hypothetical protein BC332_02049 [Capsicum chinense]|nr:hypothetical protein BC332_02049 [Capsicum chinense]